MLNLKRLSDNDLLGKTKKLVTQERELLTHILSSLREVDLRRLYSELGYKSLYEYAVKELKYSEGQAGRRIQALRLIKEIPKVEKKIELGKLSLSNICRAQSFFRETKKNSKTASLKIEEKIEILEKLENKSSRDGERLLMALSPVTALPKEKKRIIDDQHTQVSFIMNEKLKIKLEKIKSLLPPGQQHIDFSELLNKMADCSLKALSEKKFGKKRTALTKMKSERLSSKKSLAIDKPDKLSSKKSMATAKPARLNSKNRIAKVKTEEFKNKSCKLTPPPELQGVKSKSRYISKALKYYIYQRDESKCKHCGSMKNLNIDHIRPLGKGGFTEVNNLRLLCFSCNQRAAIKEFGLTKMLASIKS